MRVLELVRGSGRSLSGAVSPNGGFEQGPDTFHLTFDPEHESAAQAVVKAASLVHNVDTTELRPLADAIDPDALEALVGNRVTRDRRNTEVTFCYENLSVTVDAEGNVWLRWD